MEGKQGLPRTVLYLGFTGKIGPEKSACKLSKTLAPTDDGLSLAPITAMEPGLNILYKKCSSIRFLIPKT